VFRFALEALYLLGNNFRFRLLKISWVDARGRLKAVWKTNFLIVSIMKFSDRPSLTMWVTNTFKAALICIKPRKIMDILMVSSVFFKPEPEAAVSIFSTSDDGCCDTRNM